MTSEDTLRAAIESRGGYTMVMEKRLVRQIVCASKRVAQSERRAAGLGGNSFWLAQDGLGTWFLVTWAGEAWRMPTKNISRIAEIVMAVLSSQEGTIHSVPKDIADEYGLRKIQGDPFTRPGDDSQ